MIVCVTLPRMARYGYARISAHSQRDDSQLDALRAVGCERIRTDTASGHAAARAAMACQPHEPVTDVSCSGCGDGPLITGQSPEPGGQLAPPVQDWLHSRGWQL